MSIDMASFKGSWIVSHVTVKAKGGSFDSVDPLIRLQWRVGIIAVTGAQCSLDNNGVPVYLVAFLCASKIYVIRDTIELLIILAGDWYSTRWGRDNTAAFLQKWFSKAVYWMEIFVFSRQISLKFNPKGAVDIKSSLF